MDIGQPLKPQRFSIFIFRTWITRKGGDKDCAELRFQGWENTCVE